MLANMGVNIFHVCLFLCLLLLNPLEPRDVATEKERCGPIDGDVETVPPAYHPC